MQNSSRANPFTGELYDADIRISADFLRYMQHEYTQFIQPLTSMTNDMSRAIHSPVSKIQRKPV